MSVDPFFPRDILMTPKIATGAIYPIGLYPIIVSTISSQ